MSDKTRSDIPVLSLANFKEEVADVEYPLTLKFDMVQSKEYQNKRDQKNATKKVRFQQSLLQGSPVEPQVISESRSLSAALVTFKGGSAGME